VDSVHHSNRFAGFYFIKKQEISELCISGLGVRRLILCGVFATLAVKIASYEACCPTRTE
jgi:hypothetical protein